MAYSRPGEPQDVLGVPIAPTEPRAIISIRNFPRSACREDTENDELPYIASPCRSARVIFYLDDRKGRRHVAALRLQIKGTYRTELRVLSVPSHASSANTRATVLFQISRLPAVARQALLICLNARKPVHHIARLRPEVVTISEMGERYRLA